MVRDEKVSKIVIFDLRGVKIGTWAACSRAKVLGDDCWVRARAVGPDYFSTFDKMAEKCHF